MNQNWGIYHLIERKIINFGNRPAGSAGSAVCCLPLSSFVDRSIEQLSLEFVTTAATTATSIVSSTLGFLFHIRESDAINLNVDCEFHVEILLRAPNAERR